MDHTFILVPLVILIALGKGGLPLVTDAKFRQPASAPQQVLSACICFHLPHLLKEGRQPLQSAIYPSSDRLDGAVSQSDRICLIPNRGSGRDI